MTTEEQPLRIIGNESNTVIEIEPGNNTVTTDQHTTEEKNNAAQQSPSGQNSAATQRTDEVATNDGAVIETLDTALHNTPGVAEGTNLSGSNRADYYESRSQGKTDAEEELDALNDTQP